MRIKPFFARYDLFMGVYWDHTKKFLYVLVLPTLGLRIDLQGGPRCRECAVPLSDSDRFYLEDICSGCDQRVWVPVTEEACPEAVMERSDDLVDDRELPTECVSSDDLTVGDILMKNLEDDITGEAEPLRILQIDDARDLFDCLVWSVLVTRTQLIHNREQRRINIPKGQGVLRLVKEDQSAEG